MGLSKADYQNESKKIAVAVFYDIKNFRFEEMSILLPSGQWRPRFTICPILCIVCGHCFHSNQSISLDVCVAITGSGQWPVVIKLTEVGGFDQPSDPKG